MALLSGEADDDIRERISRDWVKEGSNARKWLERLWEKAYRHPAHDIAWGKLGASIDEDEAESPSAPDHLSEASAASLQQRKWESYLDWLAGISGGIVEGWSDRTSDQETLRKILHSYRKAARESRYSSFSNSANLWRFLVEVTIRFPLPVLGSTDRAQVATVAEAPPTGTIQDSTAETLAEEFPESYTFALQFVERVASCMRQTVTWDEDVLRRIVFLGLANYQVTRVASELDESPVFVELALNIIKERWIPHAATESQGVS